MTDILVKHPICYASFLVVLSACVVESRASDQSTANPTSPQQHHAASPHDQADWDAICKSIETYVAAYNDHDAGAIANLYTENAELVDTSGTVFSGRPTIATEYAKFFEAHPEATLTMVVDNIAFVSTTTVIEDGHTVSQNSDESPPRASTYVAVHVKQDGAWKLASVRDQEIPAETESPLEELTWLIGRWVDEAPESLMEIDCYWHPSGAYLVRDFNIQIAGLLASSGTERIGWDPLAKQIRSWLFDSQGGHLEASWQNRAGQWTATATGFSADGAPIRATYVMSPLRDDAYHMEAFHRSSGEELLDDFEMTIVRRPPQPGDVPVPQPTGDARPSANDTSE